jgi:Gas vesicle protein G
MIILDSLIMGGIRFVLDQVATAVDNEMNDEGGLREQLLAAQMQLELGEIEEEDFVAVESSVMARLREIREAREGGAAMGLSGDSRVVGVDVTFGGAGEDSDER